MDVCLSTRNVSQAWAQATRGYSLWGEGGPAYKAHSCDAGAAYNRARLDFRLTRPNWAFAFVALSATLSLSFSLSLTLLLPLYVLRFVRNYDKKRFYLGLYLPPTVGRTD